MKLLKQIIYCVGHKNLILAYGKNKLRLNFCVRLVTELFSAVWGRYMAGLMAGFFLLVGVLSPLSFVGDDFNSDAVGVEYQYEVVGAQNFDKLVVPKPSTLPGPSDSSQNKNYFRDTLIVSITRTLISLVGGIALLFFIIGGVRMLTAYGEESAITEGKKMVQWSIIGFLITVFSYAIVTIIGNIQL